MTSPDARDRFMISLKGEKIASKWVVLSQFGFEKNSIFTNTIETEDVGKLLAVTLKSEGQKAY